MKPNPPSDPDDVQVDRLLARRYCDTSPDFEARWTALKRDLRQAPVPHRWRWPAWVTWAGFGALGAAAALVFVVTRPPPPAPVTDMIELSPQLAELLAMDSVLERASPLLDEENRAALLELPADAGHPR